MKEISNAEKIMYLTNFILVEKLSLIYTRKKENIAQSATFNDRLDL